MIPPNLDLSHKVILLTGGSHGIGYHTAKTLCTYNASVCLTSRSLEAAKAAQQRMLLEGVSRAQQLITPEELDLGDLKSVDSFVSRFLCRSSRLDVLVCNGLWIHVSSYVF